MRLLTSKQINRLEKKAYNRGINIGFDIGYKTGWADKRYRNPELDAVVIAELEAILRGA